MSSIGSGGPTSWQASLLQAAGKGDEAKVRELLEESVAVLGDKHKLVLRAALQKVAGRGHEPLTRLLLAKGADVNKSLDGEVSALFKAAEAGREKIVTALLEYGADTEARDKARRTAIFPAAQRNHCAVLRKLLKARANVNARDGNDQTVLLYLAAEKPDKQVRWSDEVIKTLLGADVNLEARDKEGRTALLWAAATGRESLATALLAGHEGKRANIQAMNHRGKTALHLAAENHRVALVRLLLRYNADPHARSDGGWTALHNVADKGHKDIAALLLEYGANANATTSSGMTALHWCSRNGHLDVVELLLQQRGIKRNVKDSFDSTPMLGAAQNGHLEIVERLSPADGGDLLSDSARGACKGFQATVVDFGMEHRPMNHAKHSVFDVLYGWDDQRQKPLVTTLTRKVHSQPKFRWIHLPTNNMTWVEALVTKHFVENGARDVEGFKLLEKSFVQLHHGPTVHSHFMRPHCQRMPPTGANRPSLDDSEKSEQKGEGQPNTPTLQVEITPPKGTETPKKGTEKTKKGDKKAEKVEKGTSSPGLGSASKKLAKNARPDSSPHGRRDGKQQQRGKTPVNKVTKKPEPSGNIVLYMPYLHYETHQKRKEMSNVIKQVTSKSDSPYYEGRTCDEMLIQAYLRSTHNLQIRRTLDQFYYHAISTDDRDEDQVVYRYTKDKGKEVKVFMVDQLWFWILSDDLIVTSFPQRWNQPKNDPLNVLDGIIEDMSSKTRPPVKSVHDLAVLITGRCSGVFDRHRVGDEEYQFLDMFESSIGEVTNKETELFKKFNDASSLAAQWLQKHNRGRSIRSKSLADVTSADSDGDEDRDLDHPSSTDSSFVDTLLDIGEETALLAETKDIRDELNMISLVLKHQLQILEDLTNAMLAELRGRQDRQTEVKRRFRDLCKVVEMHLKDVERMDRQAEGIYASLAHLLDLKQKHANAFEARFARDQAAFTGRQGQTIMVFTIVTVVFLPMSFIAAVFTIPIRDFPHQNLNGGPSLPLSYVSKFVFGVGLAISIPLIAVAFFVDNLGIMCRRSLRRIANLGRSGGAKLWEPRDRRNPYPYGGQSRIAEEIEIEVTEAENGFSRRSADVSAYKRPFASANGCDSSSGRTDTAPLSVLPPGGRRRSLMGSSRPNGHGDSDPNWRGNGDPIGRHRGNDLEKGPLRADRFA